MVLSPIVVDQSEPAASVVVKPKYSEKPKDYYQYELVGVLVHTGTAQAGHYYSFIRERSGEK